MEELVPKTVKNIASIDIAAFLDISSTIDGKRTILVFDDLERCKADIIDVLGAINDYCENKGIRTIIVANQEKINLQKDEEKNKDKLSYSEIKEKIIQRTICYKATVEDITQSIQSALENKTDDYKEFVTDNMDSLVSMVMEDSASKNLRSLKCAVIDYNRIYDILKSAGIENQKAWFLNFVSYLMTAKDGITEENNHAALMMDSTVRSKYPEYQNDYVLDSVKTWIRTGLWNEELVKKEAQMRTNREKGLSPTEVIQTNSLVDMEESIIEKGWSDYLKNAYEGVLSLDDYVLLIRNSYWSRELNYEFPEKIDWDKIIKGILIRIETIKNQIEKTGVFSGKSNEGKDDCESLQKMRYSIGMEYKNYYTKEEWDAYQIIYEFRNNDGLRCYKNRMNYINVMKSDPMSLKVLCGDKKYDAFTIDMAEVTEQTFEDLSNADKHIFVTEFKSMWQDITLLDKDKYAESISGYRQLGEKLNQLVREYQKTGRKIAEVHGQDMLDLVKEIVEKLEKYLNDNIQHQARETMMSMENNEKSNIEMDSLYYTDDELDCLRYYQGDTDHYHMEYRMKNEKDFYSVSNAYEVLNTLLYPGISNEEARIIREKRKLSPIMLDHMDEILNVYGHMISAIYKNTKTLEQSVNKDAGEIRVYRFDRENSIQFLQVGETCSFMSTTQGADLNYFKKKCGLVLEEIVAERGTPYINMNEALGVDSPYAFEREVLFPPFVKLEMDKTELSDIEKGYTDKEGKPPVGKWTIHMKAPCIKNNEGIINDSDLTENVLKEKNEPQIELIQSQMMDELKKEILEESEILNAKAVWKQMEFNQNLTEPLKTKYTEWKKRFRNMSDYCVNVRDKLYDHQLNEPPVSKECIKKKYNKILEGVYHSAFFS